MKARNLLLYISLTLYSSCGPKEPSVCECKEAFKTGDKIQGDTLEPDDKNLQLIQQCSDIYASMNDSTRKASLEAAASCK